MSSRQDGNFTTPVDSVLKALGYRRNVVMPTASFLFIPEIASASDLFAFVPCRLFRTQPDHLTMIEIP